MADEKYIFKITPNLKTVVINSDVLFNGYPDVEYPLPFKDMSTLGYTINTDTFKFADVEQYKNFNTRYPTKIEMELTFTNLRFYGVNKKYNTDMIVYDLPVSYVCEEDYEEYVSAIKIADNYTHFFSSFDGTYDMCTLGYIDPSEYLSNETLDNSLAEEPSEESDELNKEAKEADETPENNKEDEEETKEEIVDEPYHAKYTVILKIYWSDNKSHAEELNKIQLTPEIVETLLTPLIAMSIKGNRLISSDDYLSIGNEIPEIPNQLIDRYIYKSFGNNTDREYLCRLPDNMKEEMKDAVSFTVSATFTDNITGMSLTAYDNIIVKQDPYTGLKQGYLHLNFIDTIPLELWSPQLNIEYITSLDNEANPKIDKTILSEYYSFNFKDTFSISNKDLYKYAYPDLYFPGAIPFTSTQSNSSDGILDDEYALNNCFSLESCMLWHFCLNDFYEDPAFIPNFIDLSFLTKLDSRVFFPYSIKTNEDENLSVNENFDYVKFSKRFDICKKDYSKNTVKREVEIKEDNNTINRVITLNWALTKSTKQGMSNTSSKTLDFPFATAQLKKESTQKLPTITTNTILKPGQIVTPNSSGNHISLPTDLIWSSEIMNQWQKQFADSFPKILTPINEDDSIGSSIDISVDSTIIAQYALYCATDGTYYQVICSVTINDTTDAGTPDTRIYYFCFNDNNDHDIEEYAELCKHIESYTIKNKTLEFIDFYKDELTVFTDSNGRTYKIYVVSPEDEATILNYKVIQDKSGTSILYKLCVNNPIECVGNSQKFLIPSFAIYPILSGWVPVYYMTYDYTSNDEFVILPETYNDSLLSYTTNLQLINTLYNDKKYSAYNSAMVSLVFRNDTIFRDPLTSKLSINYEKLYKDISENQKTNGEYLIATGNSYGDNSLLSLFLKKYNTYFNNIRENYTKLLLTDFLTSYMTTAYIEEIKELIDTFPTFTNPVISVRPTPSIGIYSYSPFNEYTSPAVTSMTYGLPSIGETDDTYIITIKKISDDFKRYIRINGVPYNTLYNGSISSRVNPGLFIISVDDYPYYLQDTIDIQIKLGDDIYNTKLVITNDENEKHLRTYKNKGDIINNTHSSSLLLRTNPKLTGNIKLVVDSGYNMYLDTFKVNALLNNKAFRKQHIAVDGNYPMDIRMVFKDIPSNILFKVPENSMNAHKVYTDFNDLYETIYEYGAETNTDNLYSENMKILAPLHIGDNIPEFFAIFKYGDIFNTETYKGNVINDNKKFLSLLEDSSIVQIYDLRTHTSIGQYLNNYHEMLTNYGSCYLLFIEQDNDERSKSYRQGNNIWKGISVKRGILTDLSETTYFGSKILNNDDIENKQEQFNNYIISGFERHNLLYPNIINLEFMFNDYETYEYEMNRYFGLYLTANDFIEYGYALGEDINDTITRFDVNGNIYTGDKEIYNTIFTEKYNDRLFFAITNNNAARIKSEVDLDTFMNMYVKNTPDYNIVNLTAQELIFDENDKSFVTLHFHKPILAGEHIKFIALNYLPDNKSYVDAKDVIYNSKELTLHIVYEIIASTDERLLNTEDNISPFVNVHKCRYSENTYFYRMSFYVYDTIYENLIPATLDEQVLRIKACIEKMNGIIRVGSYDGSSISIISSYDEMYVQHIDKHSFDDFNYDYMCWESINSSILTTNKIYTESLRTIPSEGIDYMDIYTQSVDTNRDWINLDNELSDGTTINCYVEAEDPLNIKDDSISYFNSKTVYKMHALSNQSDYFDGYYAAFSNYGFETIGWRYNNIVKFVDIKSINYTYEIADKNVEDIVNTIHVPLAYTYNSTYEAVLIHDINYGYLRNNLIDPDIYTNYTEPQQINFQSLPLTVIVSPYNTRHTLISSRSNILMNGTQTIKLYKPQGTCVSIMGISNICDIDTTLELDTSTHLQTKIEYGIEPGVTLSLDESDYRMQHCVMYEVVSGSLLYNNDKKNIIKSGHKFIVIPVINEQEKTYELYVDNILEPVNIESLAANTYTIIKVVDKQIYQDYNFDIVNPKLSIKNFFTDPTKVETSDLVYPIVPSVNCNWKSNGEYFDFSSILDVSTLNKGYNTQGLFPENVYNPGKFHNNLYIQNKIDNILYVNNTATTYRLCILNSTIQSPIRKMLIDNNNINTASVYYNSTILSLEFIFSGVRFNIKLNSKVINSHIHLDQYSGFDAFVLIDYNPVKSNEMFISMEEKFILLINHQFYIDYKHEGDNNIKCVTNDKFLGYSLYSSYVAPYSIDFSTTQIVGTKVVSNKKSSIHEYLTNTIDKHNLWSAIFAQYDTPAYNNGDSPLFISAYLEDIAEYKDYVTFAYSGVYNQNSEVVRPYEYIQLNSKISNSNPYIVVKADGEYNHLAITLLSSINEKIFTISNTKDSSNGIIKNDNGYDRLITADEAALYMKLLSSRGSTDDLYIKTLSSLLGTPAIQIFVNPDNENQFKNVMIRRNDLEVILEYITKIIALESPKEKLLRYVLSFDNNIDIYIIPKTSEVKYIKNRNDNAALLFELSIPNNIKFNYGWFSPNMNNMIDFELNDELSNVLNTDLMLTNTKFKNIKRVNNYVGNKVFEDNHLLVLDANYFIESTHSLLSSTWDRNYYRTYTSEDEFKYTDGYLTGVDDKSFFGSRCMTLRNDYLLLNKWAYETANDIYDIYENDSSYNTNSRNTRSVQLTINITSAIYNHFINNKAFIENWSMFKQGEHTGMKNYITNIILTFYNLNSNIDLCIYAINTNVNKPIKVINVKPDNMDNYYVLENYTSKVELKNGMYILTVDINNTTGMNIYPTLKIYRK